ncbi:unnamed protein product [Arctogadus glacialis]
MARQTSLSNYIKRVRTESPDAAGPATAPAPARQAVGLAWEEGPIGGQEGAASQSSSAGSLAPVDLSAIDEPAAQPKLKKYPITGASHHTVNGTRASSAHKKRCILIGDHWNWSEDVTQGGVPDQQQ